MTRTDGDGDNLQLRLLRLQEGKLDFNRVFGVVRRAVFLQGREALDQRGGQAGIGRNVAQWSPPSSVSHNRERLSLARVIRAENNAVPRNFHSRINCTRDRSRVNISRMRGDATNGGNAIGRRRVFRQSSVAPNIA
jgi:hypothetical protein